MRVTILFYIGTDDVRYCFVEENTTSSNGLTWALPCAYHGCNPSPSSLPLCKAPASLPLVLDCISSTHRWHQQCISQVSHCQVPKGEPTSLMNQIFSRVSPSVHQRHWYHIMAWHIPALHTSSHRRGCFGGRELRFFKTNLLPIEVVCGDCKETVPGFLCFSHYDIVTHSVTHDIGNEKETSTLRIAAILSLPSMPHLSSTPRPVLELFSAAFLMQTFESGLEPKMNKKPNTLPTFFFFLMQNADTLFHTCLYSNLRQTACF